MGTKKQLVRPAWYWWLVGATGLLLFSHLRLYQNSFTDDVFIGYRYAKNLFLGHGLTWNPGEKPVEGYSNFLWVVSSLIPLKLNIDILTFGRNLGALFLFITAFLVFTPVNRVTKDSRSLIAFLLLIAVSPLLCFYAVSGMETAMFTALVTAGALAYLRGIEEKRAERWNAISGLLFGLSALTRPEGWGMFLIVGLFECYLLYRQRRREKRSFQRWAQTFLLIAGTHLLWRLYYYGYPLPNTYYAKYGSDGIVDKLYGLFYFGGGFRSYLTVPFAVALGTALGLSLEKRRLLLKAHLDLQFIFFFSVCYYGYVFVVGGDDTQTFPSARLFVPALPLLYLGVAAFLERVLASPQMLAPSLAIYVGLAIVPQIPEAKELLQRGAGERLGLATRVRDIAALITKKSQRTVSPELANWITDRTAPGDWVAIGMAGIIPYYLDRPVLDIFGLNDIHIGHLPKIHRGVCSKMDNDYVMGKNPRIVVLTIPPEIASGKQPLNSQFVLKVEQDLLGKLQQSGKYVFAEDAPALGPTKLSVFIRQ